MTVSLVPEAEAAVLGTALMTPTLVRRYALDEQLLPEHFGLPIYARTWRAMLDIDAGDGRVDEITVAAALQGEWPDPAGLMGELLLAAGSASGWRDYARIVRDHARRRRVAEAGRKLTAAAALDDESLVAEAEHLLSREATSEEHTADPRAVGDLMTEWLGDTGGRVAWPTGLSLLDAKIGGGLRPGDCTAVGAWTSMGKSVLVDGMLESAHAAGARCHLYLNEMSYVDRALRLVADMAAVPYPRLVNRARLDEHEWTRVLQAAERMPFGMTDVSQWDAARIGRHIRTTRPDVAALDLLHNMDYQREGELSQILNVLANAALSAGTHLILVCQLNEERAKTEILPRPVLRDIRGSGMVKNRCATVLLLHREQRKDSGLVWTDHTAQIEAAKARHGERGSSATATFVPSRMRFVPGATA